MASNQKLHVVRNYVIEEKRGLMLNQTLTFSNSNAAQAGAEKLYETGRYDGVDAFSVTVDEETGEHGEQIFHARLGRVPEFSDV